MPEITQERQREQEIIDALTCGPCYDCPACTQACTDIEAVWEEERQKHPTPKDTTRRVTITFDYLLDEESIATIGRAWKMKPEDVTNDKIRDYTIDALTMILDNERN